MFVFVEYLTDFVLLVPCPRSYSSSFGLCATVYPKQSPWFHPRPRNCRSNHVPARPRRRRPRAPFCAQLPRAGRVRALNATICLICALLYIWFQSFHFAFLGIYHWREQLLGLSFLGLLSARSSSCPPSSRTCITSRSPSVTTRMSSSHRNACPSPSSALCSSQYVCSGSDGHRARACTGSCPSSTQASSASPRSSSVLLFSHIETKQFLLNRRTSSWTTSQTHIPPTRRVY